MKYFSFSLKQLKILQALKNEANIKNAGKSLYLSQPALSSQLRKLEYNIDSKILVRKKNKLAFTPEGELVLDYANKILKLCEEADYTIVYFKKLKKFSLKIGSNKVIGKNISLKLIKIFCKRYSYARIQLQIGSTKSLSWDIISGKIDIGIVQNDDIPKRLSRSLHMTPYFQERMAIIIPKYKKQKYLNTITIEELYQLNFITIKPSFQEREFMDSTLKKFNVNVKNLKVKLELNSIGAIKKAVEDGLGVSFLPNILIQEELDLKRFHAVRIESNNSQSQFILMVNLKNIESYLVERFYNYCFSVLQPNLYKQFLNLS